ncbi:MAG: CpsD/CapB family tyrosine-protein kinase [Pseudomonadales bacterium]
MQAESREPASSKPAPAGPEARSIELDHDHLRDRHVLLYPDRQDLAAVDVYRLLRTRLLLQMRPNGWTRIGITSAGDKEGKSLTSINLACSLAKSGPDNVVVVDADLRKPNLADTLGFGVEVGVVDHLVDRTPIEDILVRPHDVSNLFLLPGRRIEEDLDVPELVGSSAMSEMLSRIGRMKSTITIVDLPPVLVGDDVLSLASQLDALLLVVEEGRTDIEELKKAAELTSRFNVLGSVLNKSRHKLERFESYYYHGQ